MASPLTDRRAAVDCTTFNLTSFCAKCDEDKSRKINRRR
ncbi:hypothetical protein CC1G_14921 [Coprinopsis cinerea okayama7|uniref:Uncharacterized protein n=1 Tax=Coprinopsis cinerea (strain Okayama-7 / 130 / ATCC MYA-4618 / FGSC 9003) TaxID=240176 RepID=D6RNY6_COPC7|nr:hypothetical protein CC1G_14921 [Coprinopsis cinerea okayama7\|eukprot:XP_002910943.1 hypothetical protein CC1G_14921 [Coprinopsis cinerea okayama7\